MTELPIDENTPRILIVEDETPLGQLPLTTSTRGELRPHAHQSWRQAYAVCVKRRRSNPAGSDAALAPMV